MFAQCLTDQQKGPSTKPEYYKFYCLDTSKDLMIKKSLMTVPCSQAVLCSCVSIVARTLREGRGQDWERACAPCCARLLHASCVHKLFFPLTVEPYAYLPPWLKKLHIRSIIIISCIDTTFFIT